MADELRMFWNVFTYACDKCKFEIKFYLEDGCEGPSLPVDRWLTPSGRRVVPVPFIAAGCPKCQGAPPWKMDGGALTHVRWNEDITLNPMRSELELPVDEGHAPAVSN